MYVHGYPKRTDCGTFLNGLNLTSEYSAIDERKRDTNKKKWEDEMKQKESKPNECANL